MDCLIAQQLVSAALDGEPVGHAELDAAKEHCAACAECTAFVRTLAAMQRTPAPSPPADLADRAATYARSVVAAERAAAPPTEAEVAAPAAATPLPERIRAIPPRRLAAWAGAAAVLLVASGVASWMGVRAILVPPEPQVVSETAAPAADQGAAAPQSAEGYGSTLARAGTAPDYITVNGAVYVLARESREDTSSMDAIGQTTTSLSQQEPQSRTVFRRDGDPEVYLADDTGALLEFDPVIRRFRGVNYHLQSAPIPSFGEWPTLPSTMQPPAEPDGSPTFERAGTANGVDVYTLAGSSASAGIAIPPGTPGDDPAAGNPNWTWWTPTE